MVSAKALIYGIGQNYESIHIFGRGTDSATCAACSGGAGP